MTVEPLEPNATTLGQVADALAELYERIAADRARADRTHRGRLDGYLARLRTAADLIAARLAVDVVDDEDTADVPATVRLLAQHLCRSYARAWPPTHPYPGNDSERAGRGDPGHCWVCAVVGHAVAHPERGCADVQCYSEHTGEGAGVDPVVWMIDLRARGVSIGLSVSPGQVRGAADRPAPGAPQTKM